MKKRKRRRTERDKLRWPPDALILSCCFLSLIAVCLHLLAAQCAANSLLTSKQFDDDHELDRRPSEAAKNEEITLRTLRKSSSESENVSTLEAPHSSLSGNLSEDNPLRIGRQSNWKQLTLIASSSAGRQQAEEISNSQNYLSGDLVALETAMRSQRPISPPYESHEAAQNLTTGAKQSGDQQQQQQQVILSAGPYTQPAGEGQLLKLYRSPHLPTYIGHLSSGPPPMLRLEPIPQGDLKRAPVQSPPVRSLPAAPVTSLLPAWQSLYYPPRALKRVSPGAIKTTPPYADGHAHEVSAVERVQASKSKNNKQPSAASWRIMNTGELGSSHWTANGSNFATPTSGGEAAFEHSLAAGHYQRTQLAANMSWPELLRQAAESNVMESLMVTNRSMVSLVCDTGHMVLRLRFKLPFRGSIRTTLDRNNNCRLQGTGAHYYEWRIGLHECATRQEMPRLFVNNIQIQFHQHWSLDSVEDEVKTIVCSYPIRPRAPPAPDLFAPPRGIPERIIEQPSEPAKLVHYEPLVLIAALLMISLGLLGLTTGAYLVAKRVRGSRSRLHFQRPAARARHAAPLYPEPPERSDLFLAPPLIGKPPPGEAGGRGATRSPLGFGSIKYSPGTRLVGRPLEGATGPASGKRYPNYDGPNEVASARQQNKRRAKKITDTATRSKSSRPPGVSMEPAGDGSGDSLADKSSVTTIEIPYVATAGGSTNADMKTPTTQAFSSGRRSGEPRDSLRESKGTKVARHDAEATTRAEATTNDTSPPSAALEPSSKTTGAQVEVDTGGVRYAQVRSHSSQQQQQQQQKVNISGHFQTQSALGPKSAPKLPGGLRNSLRTTLTNPREFKRLQRIASLFDEVFIERRVDDEETGGEKIVYNSRLSPSKYKSKILDTMDEQERHLLGGLLSRNEIFRSLVVECIDRAKFRRKLRENPTYSGKFKPATWDLLEQILLDRELAEDEAESRAKMGAGGGASSTAEKLSITEALTTSGGLVQSAPGAQKVNLGEAKAKQERREIERNELGPGELSSSGQMKESDAPVVGAKVVPPPPGQVSLSSERGGDESVLVQVDARNVPSSHLQAHNQDSLESDSTESDLTSSEESEIPSKLFVDEPKKVQPREKQRPMSERSSAPNKLVSPAWAAATSASGQTQQQQLAQETIKHRDLVRVSQFNSSSQEGGMTGTLINIDSVTNFTSSKKDFSTFTRSSVEHTRYEAHTATTDDSLPYVDQAEGTRERVASYEYTNEQVLEFRHSPSASQTLSRQEQDKKYNTFDRRPVKRASDEKTLKQHGQSDGTNR